MSRSMKKTVLAAMGLAMAWASLAHADVDAAKGYVKEAEELIGSNNFDDAGSKLELAEAELDGASGADKATVEKAIAKAKGTITAAKAAADKPKYQRMLQNGLRDAEGAIGNMVTWDGAAAQMEELFKDDAAKAALGPALADAEKKFGTFKKLHMKKAAAEYVSYAEQRVKDVESQWAESKPVFADADASPNSKDGAIEDTQRKIESAREQIAKVPADMPQAKALTARVDKIAAEFTKIALAEKVKEAAERLQSNLELYANEYDGWDAETKPPTWAEFRKQTGGAMDSLNLPKTRAVIERVGDFLGRLKENDDYKAVAGAPEVKAVVAKAQGMYDKAYAKTLQFAKPMVEAAAKDKIDEDNDWSRLISSIRLGLGEESKEGLAMRDRLQKQIDAHAAATTGADAAMVELIQTLRTKANESWEQLSAGIAYESGADFTDLAALKGKTVRFDADNLMGYRFKPGDFYYATTLGGTPVAAKIDPAIMAGIKATEAKIGRALGDDDGDGRWDVIAIVTDRRGKLMAKRQVEATGTIDGEQVKVTGEYAEPVEAVIIEIVAAKCGPFAGAKGKGVLKPDGTVGQ